MSPISGSIDRGDSFPDISERIEQELNVNKPQLLYNKSSFKSSSLTATNELPLTELNLELFTCENDYDYFQNGSLASSTNELPLSDIRFKHDDGTASCIHESRRSMVPSRSFSDPNILDLDEDTIIDDFQTRDSNYFPPLDSHVSEIPKVKSVRRYQLLPLEVPLYPNTFYPTEANVTKHLLNTPPSRSASHPAQLSLVNSVCHPIRSLSNPDNLSPGAPPLKRIPSPPTVVTQSPVNPEAGAKRHRHSIAGQMSYIKMLGFGFGGPIGLKKIAGGSSNSLFSTAVISGSSSAPNLRDMIPNNTSATGIFLFFF